MKKVFFLLFFVFSASSAFSNESRSLKYFKFGTEMGIGYQRSQGAHGVDASCNATLLGFFNFFNAKCLYIDTPFYESHRYFYWGMGGGICHEIDAIPLGGDMGGRTHYLTYPTLEGVMGVQFFAEKKCKCFVQLQLALPISKETFPIIPGLSFGVGF